jgi:hypothetical protein
MGQKDITFDCEYRFLTYQVKNDNLTDYLIVDYIIENLVWRPSLHEYSGGKGVNFILIYSIFQAALKLCLA